MNRYIIGGMASQTKHIHANLHAGFIVVSPDKKMISNMLELWK